jgi:pimeloyl-ACP methyl ester carboxylesterase
LRDRGTPNSFQATDDAVRPGVVLLHGIGRTSRSLRRLERALQEAGFATLNLDYQSRKKPLDALAGDIHPAIIDFAEANKGPLHFVAHSMGGLLTRVYVAKYRPERLAHVVMLGTPNGGSEVADVLKGLAIYRAYYGPSGQQLSTRQDPGMMDHVTVKAFHRDLVRHPVAIGQTIAFLLEGRFKSFSTGELGEGEFVGN